jgi:hypothetical protein
MNIDGIVTQLETVEGLNGKVVVGQPATTDSLGNGPTCWITDISESAGPNTRVNAPALQRIDARLGITLAGADLDAVLTMRDAVRAALIDYQPDAPGDPITYRAGRMEFLDPGIVLWRDEYTWTKFLDLLEV